MSEKKFQEGIAAEQRAVELFTTFVRDHRKELLPIASWGDGECGHMRDILYLELFGEPIRTFRVQHRQGLDRKLAKQVFERDAYRCQHCGDYHDLTRDQVVPLIAGGATTIENLQTLCRSCNSRKGASHG